MNRWTTAAFAVVGAAAVAATLLVRPADPGPRPGPLWETRAAASCALPAATWDEGEAPSSFAVAGDSVLGQGMRPITALAEARCHTVTYAARSGGAPCDLWPDYADVMSAQPLRRVVLAWVGNVGASPCMVDLMGDTFGTARWGDDANGPATLTSQEIVRAGQLYDLFLRRMVGWNLAHNVATVLAFPPPMRSGTYHNQMEDQLIARYNNVANSYGGVWVSSTARDLLGGATWTQTIAGQRVRNDDSVHLYAPTGTGLWALGIVDAATT